MAKLARALQQGFWDGCRRRAGTTFPVADGAEASWFEIVGEADDADLPEPLKGPAAPPAKNFVQAMAELSKDKSVKRTVAKKAGKKGASDDASDLV